jgi:hypothetical protein
MKPSPEDSRLSAYLLGELPPDERARMERAIAADPALRLSLGELQRVAGLLEETLSSAPPALRPAQRDAVLRAARQAAGGERVIEFASASRRRGTWVAVLGAAAAVVLALTLVSRFATTERREGLAAGDGVAVSLLPMPGGDSSQLPVAPAGGGGTARSGRDELRGNPGGYLERMSSQIARSPLPDPARLPALRPLPALREGGEIRLPVLIGQASYGWVRGWVRERATLPPANAVRLEELVNAFPLPVAVDRGFGSSIETAACPWNPRSVLVAATLVGRAGSELPVNWSFEAAESARVRLIASPGSGAEALPDRLPGGRPVTVLLEIAPSPGSERLGVLKLEVAGEFSGRIVERPRATASPAMRQLGLIAAFGLWLRGEELGTTTLEAVLAAAGGDEDPGRADTRRLVREALDLAASRR